MKLTLIFLLAAVAIWGLLGRRTIKPNPPIDKIEPRSKWPDDDDDRDPHEGAFV